MKLRAGHSYDKSWRDLFPASKIDFWITNNCENGLYVRQLCFYESALLLPDISPSKQKIKD